jgi:hypothetical protein
VELNKSKEICVSLPCTSHSFRQKLTHTATPHLLFPAGPTNELLSLSTGSSLASNPRMSSRRQLLWMIPPSSERIGRNKNNQKNKSTFFTVCFGTKLRVLGLMIIVSYIRIRTPSDSLLEVVLDKV